MEERQYKRKSTPMHVGIVGPCSSGPLAEFLPESNGINLGWGGYSVVNLVRELIRRGHRVSVITLSPELTESRILRGLGLTFYIYPTRTARRMRDLYKVERQGLREGILLAKPDLLHAHWTYEFALACLETGLPTLVTCRDNAFRVLQHGKSLYTLGRLYLQTKVIRKSRFLTAVSPYIAHSLSWLARKEIEVVPNFIEIPHEIKQQFNQDLGHVRIATVLQWEKLKNPKAAIIAFDLLRRQLPDAEMFMYGPGFEERGPASQWTANQGIGRSIRFCGQLPHHELQQKLRSMSILLHPSFEESFSMAVIESMAAGISVVGGIKSGAVPWVLDEGRAGFLTDVRDPEKIAQTVLTCVRQTEEREQKQRNAYDRLRDLFSPDSVTGQYEKIYHRVLSSPTVRSFS